MNENYDEKFNERKPSFGYFCSHRHDVGGIPRELEVVPEDHKVFYWKCLIKLFFN
jgi:hypothetical protein